MGRFLLSWLAPCCPVKGSGASPANSLFHLFCQDTLFLKGSHIKLVCVAVVSFFKAREACKDLRSERSEGKSTWYREGKGRKENTCGRKHFSESLSFLSPLHCFCFFSPDVYDCRSLLALEQETFAMQAAKEYEKFPANSSKA